MYELDELGIDTIRSVFYGDRRVRDRGHAEVKWRTPGDDPTVRVLTGYPAVFDQFTTLYEGRAFVMREQIASGAFDDVLGDDCHLNYSHESPSAMCRNGIAGPGGMELSADAHGLRVFAQMPMDDMDVMRLAPKMDRGVVDQMSFAFSVAEEDCLQTTDDQGREVYEYTIKRVSRLYDVCVCPLGAYSQTEALLRSMFATQTAGRSSEGPTVVPVRSQEGREGTTARSQEGPSRARSVLLAEGTVALMHIPKMEDIRWIHE